MKRRHNNSSCYCQTSSDTTRKGRQIVWGYGIFMAAVITRLYRVDCYTTTAGPSSSIRFCGTTLNQNQRRNPGSSTTPHIPRIESRLFMDNLCYQGENPINDKSNRNRIEDEDDNDVDHSRRHALQSLLMAAAAIPALPALAAKPEVDSSGLLFSPKADMLSGGSNAARGVSLENSATKAIKLQPGQAFQTIYETRFIAYLSRFLLNYDPIVKEWWTKNVEPTLDGTSISTEQRVKRDAKFAEFAESVEIGLADYFVGPYGSYSSLPAMKAGVDAKMPAKSARADDPSGFFEIIKDTLMMQKEKKKLREQDRVQVAKQGVLNLYTLLKARYSSNSAKRQLAILFSFFSNPDLQPTTEISSLLAEADNVSVAEIDLIKPTSNIEPTSRNSSRRGGGYSLTDVPTITVEAPPALGSCYRMATAKAIMKPSSRVLRIRVTDGGEGYTKPPDVFVGKDAQRSCEACAILDREGHVESILVLDPGYGYGKFKSQPPKVVIAHPDNKSKLGNGKTKGLRRATAVAELEYEIVAIETTAKGNGYIASSPPAVIISPPQQDPDWYVDSPELAILESEFGPIRAEVSQMQGPKGNLVFSLGETRPRLKINLDVIRKDPLQLLPSSVRPEINSYGVYVIPPVAAIATYSSSPNPRYRAVDPLFGAIGQVPVTKSANELKAGEYGRLALSGAVCTVLVRTALNPLELIKTKQQLQNDKELLSFARDKIREEAANTNSTIRPAQGSATQDTEEKIGTGDMISSMVELRGPLSLFQSADITFLASLMFGSFGFGATELFRRSFSGVFFSEGTGTGLESELVLLLAATVATIITSAAASPFELLRVRSMGLIESKAWTEVLGDFIKEKSANGNRIPFFAQKKGHEKFELKEVKPKDLLPLFAGFAPTASRELAFAIPKFLAFDILAKSITGFINSQAGPGSLPIQVGVGSAGLLISAISGAVAGLAGAIVSHPADLILTYTSASKKKTSDSNDDAGADWKEIVKDLLSREGGVANLFIGLTPRLVFFFLVIGLQFFLYDFVKSILNVGSEDLSLVLDVFYAVRRGLVEMAADTL